MIMGNYAGSYCSWCSTHIQPTWSRQSNMLIILKNKPPAEHVEHVELAWVVSDKELPVSVIRIGP